MRRALIVGAGIGGLAAGIALRKSGWDIAIFERGEAPRELGFGVGLAQNAGAALRELGVAGAIEPHLTRWRSPTAVELRHLDGRIIRRFSGDPATLSPEVEGLRLILRPALHGALLEPVRDAVRVCHDAVGVDSNAAGVTVTFANGARETGDVVIGADGFHSAIRRQLHPDEPPARASGYYALRGRSARLETLGDLQGLWCFGTGLECGAVQAGPSAIYWFMSMFVDDPQHAGATTAEEVLRRWAPRLHAQYLAITEGSELRLDELFERAPISEWGRGPVTLLGDAAHPMLPHTGQGAAQALEDAVGLGRALRDPGDPIAALRRYEAVRSRHANAVVRSGPRIARVTTTRSRAMSLVRNAAFRTVPIGLVARAIARPATDPNRRLGPPLAAAGQV